MSVLKYWDSATRTWKRIKDSIGVKSFNERTGVVTLNQTDVVNALGYTPPTDAEMIEVKADVDDLVSTRLYVDEDGYICYGRKDYEA